jgi:hypothetical protein
MAPHKLALFFGKVHDSSDTFTLACEPDPS